jgi:hypothetical protein
MSKQRLFHQDHDGRCAFCGATTIPKMFLEECPARLTAPVFESPPCRSTFDKRCVHFRAMSTHNECNVGVRYDSVRVEHEFIQYRSHGTIYTSRVSIPCFADRNYRPDLCKCEKALYPTPEEIAAHHADTDMRLGRIGRARKAIVDHLGGPWKKGMQGSSGAIACPCCSGQLGFSRSGYNGRIHARCSTPDCVSWME